MEIAGSGLLEKWDFEIYRSFMSIKDVPVDSVELGLFVLYQN